MSKKKFEIFSNVDNDGKLQNNVRISIQKQLLAFKGERVYITIEKKKKTRSTNQNAYYWGCVIKCQEDCFLERWGEVFTTHQIHDWNKSNVWCTEKVIESTGEVIKIPGSSVVSTIEFEERLELLRQFFYLNFDWKIPLPNEQLEFNH